MDLGAIAEAIKGVSNRILDYALVMAAVGTVSMALLELFKAVTRGRLFFHQGMVEQWIGKKGSIQIELLDLAVGGSENSNAFYDQPSEKMLGQIQAAANVALDFPTVYPSLYEFLTARSATVKQMADGERWKQFAPRMSQGIPLKETEKAKFEADSRESTQARARLGNLVSRRLDALQTRIDYTWARLNQTVAIVGGACLLYAVLPAVADGNRITAFGRIVTAVLGGLVSPFAKDLANRLSGLQVRR